MSASAANLSFLRISTERWTLAVKEPVRVPRLDTFITNAKAWKMRIESCTCAKFENFNYHLKPSFIQSTNFIHAHNSDKDSAIIVNKGWEDLLIWFNTHDLMDRVDDLP